MTEEEIQLILAHDRDASWYVDNAEAIDICIEKVVTAYQLYTSQRRLEVAGFFEEALKKFKK